MHSDITFIASDLLAAEKVQNILRESPANCRWSSPIPRILRRYPAAK